jgi:hypothetical protein
VTALEAVRQRVDSITSAPDALFVTARDTCAKQQRVPVTLAPYVPSGCIGSVIGKVKDGKTSTLLEMLRCLRRKASFCGFPAPETSSRVLIASEQPRTSLSKQLRDAGLHEDEGVLINYLSDWKGRPWSSVGPKLVKGAIAQGVDVIIVDTASRWFGFKGDEENQSGGAEHVDVFLPFCALGGTVIMSRHGRKSGGSASDAGRGSSAIEGAADFILQLTRPSGHGPDVRQIEAVGRFEMPGRILIRRRTEHQHPHSFGVGAGDVVGRYVFERVEDSREGDQSPARIRAVLASGAKTPAQIATISGISPNTVNRVIKQMEGVVIVGKGGPRNNAILYGLKEERTTTPPQTHRGGDVGVASVGGVQ